MATRLSYPEDHASHLPFLIGVGAYFTIRSVFEFGSGTYSTPLFLNKKAFPKVEEVVSVELDCEWRKKVRNVCGEDNRLSMLEKDPSIRSFRDLDIACIDLIFVDNGPEQHKIETIQWMSQACITDVLVVVHDAEHVPYRAEIDKFQSKLVSEKYNPGVALCSNASCGMFTPNFFEIEAKVSSNYHLAVTDVQSWIEVFRG
jgi:hypothetical protein